MHFHHMTIMAMPQRKDPCPGGHKFTIQVESSMYNISVSSVCLICAWEQRRKNPVFLLYDLYGYSFFLTLRMLQLFSRRRYQRTTNNGRHTMTDANVKCAVIWLVYMCCVLNLYVFFVFVRMCCFRLYPFLQFLCVPVTSNLQCVSGVP